MYVRSAETAWRSHAICVVLVNASLKAWPNQTVNESHKEKVGRCATALRRMNSLVLLPGGTRYDVSGTYPPTMGPPPRTAPVGSQLLREDAAGLRRCALHRGPDPQARQRCVLQRGVWVAVLGHRPLLPEDVQELCLPGHE
jgi:hypothetical protein